LKNYAPVLKKQDNIKVVSTTEGSGGGWGTAASQANHTLGIEETGSKLEKAANLRGAKEKNGK